MDRAAQLVVGRRCAAKRLRRSRVLILWLPRPATRGPAESGDYGLAHYGQLCPAGGELVVFVIEPCLAKAHGPSFQYLRDGRLITAFSFETPYYRGGEVPDLLLPVLTAANLIGSQADLDRDDNEERIVEAITAFFSLPELEMP